MYRSFKIDEILLSNPAGKFKVIDKIIAHLKLTFHAERPPPPRILQQELLIEAEEKR